MGQIEIELHRPDGPGESGHVFRRTFITGDPVNRIVIDTVHVRRDERESGRHRLERGHAEPFPFRREDEAVRRLHHFDDVIPETEQGHLPLESEFTDEPLEMLLVVTRPGDQITERRFFERGNGADDCLVVLVLVQLADRQQDEVGIAVDAEATTFQWSIDRDRLDSFRVDADPGDAERVRCLERLCPREVLFVDGDDRVGHAGERPFDRIIQHPVERRAAFEKMEAVRRIHAWGVRLTRDEPADDPADRRVAVDEVIAVRRHDGFQLLIGADVAVHLLDVALEIDLEERDAVRL